LRCELPTDHTFERVKGHPYNNLRTGFARAVPFLLPPGLFLYTCRISCLYPFYVIAQYVTALVHNGETPVVIQETSA
jgi:hypothetical protein